MAMTLEGQIVRISDIVAYVNHDLDDAVRGRVVDPATVPRAILDVLGASHGERIARMVGDMVSASRLEDKRQIRMTDEVLDALIALRDFLYDTVYERPEIRGEFEKAQRIISELWSYFHTHADEFRARHWPKGIPESDGLSRAVADFITGMTDRYALRVYEEYFLPRRWPVY
jgi:dGTPase